MPLTIVKTWPSTPMPWVLLVRAPWAVAMSKLPIVAPQRTPSRKWYWYCHGVWQAPSDEWGQWNSYVRPTCMSLQYFQSYSLTEPSVQARVRVLVRVVEVLVPVVLARAFVLGADVPVHVDGAHAHVVVVHDGSGRVSHVLRARSALRHVGG